MKWWTAILGPSKTPAMAMVTAGLAVSLVADEPVHFSDSAAKPIPSRQQKKARAGSESTLESLIGRGGSSLDALTAAPFQPVESATPRVLTPKEQERLSRERDWMFRDSADYGVTDKTAREAFGVRTEERGAPPEAKRWGGDSISRYVETSRAAESAATETALASRNNERLGGTPTSRVGGQKATGVSSVPGSDQSEGVDPGVQSYDRSDQGNASLGRSWRPSFGSLRSQGLGGLGALSSGSLGSEGGNPRDPLFGLRSPVADNLARLRSMTDPMSALLDKTKEPLNPVVAVGPPASIRAGIGTVPNDVALSVGTLRGGVGNGLNASGISSSSDNPGQLSAPTPSRIQAAPLVLDAPRRPF